MKISILPVEPAAAASSSVPLQGSPVAGAPSPARPLRDFRFSHEKRTSPIATTGGPSAMISNRTLMPAEVTA